MKLVIATRNSHKLEARHDIHETLHTARAPLRELDEKALCPGSAALEAINQSLR